MEEFWLSWTNDIVQLGSGHQLGQDTIISLNDSVHTSRNYLAVSTGFGATGYWIFHSGKIFFQIHVFYRERSGSVVECLTRYRGIAGLSLSGVTGP